MKYLIVITTIAVAGYLLLRRNNVIPVYDIPDILDDFPYYSVGGHPLDN